MRRAFADGLSRKKHPPAAKLHRTLQGCMRDLERGHVVQDDVEGWTEQQVHFATQSPDPATANL
jgi:hypothetical protein